MKKKHSFVLFFLGIAIVGALFWANREGSLTDSITDKNQPSSSESKTSQEFNKNQYSLSDPDSIWVVTNKLRPLNPKTYVPNDLVVPNMTLRATITNDEKLLRAPAATALEQMVTAAKQQGLNFTLQSGYRSYNFQVALYNRYVAEQGKTVADSQSARPGFSEHQTGLAVDLGSSKHPECDIEACFGTTEEGKWLAENASKYGFVIRYPEGLAQITGYTYEPWHIRYVGASLATEMQNQGAKTLEQFFSLPSAPDYK